MEKTNEGLTVEKLTPIEKWLRKHKLQYAAATKHPFINSIHDASIDFSSFKIWLGREYVFVKTALAPFVASVLLKAWKGSDDSSDVEVILAGLAYLNDELSWLKQEAPKWHISLTSVTVDHNPVLDYFRFFERLTSSDVKYTDAVIILWAVESIYHYGFAHCLKEANNTPEEMKAACTRWVNESVKQHCQSLETIANNRLEQASEEEVSKAEVLFLEFLENVVGFWSLNLG